MRIPITNVSIAGILKNIQFPKWRFQRKANPEKSFKRAYKRGRKVIKYRNLQCLNCNYPLVSASKKTPFF